MANELTEVALRARWRGKDRWLSDGGSRGSGRLIAKVGQGGTTFYFAYFDAADKRRFLPIGQFDGNGAKTWRELKADERGYTLSAARTRAAQLSDLYRGGITDLHQHFARELEAKERAERERKEAERRAHEDAKRSTLRQLLDAYVDYLESAGKQAARDAKTLFTNHVYDAAPDVADRKAADIPVDDFVALIAKLVHDGKGRTAAKLRSYLRAAYALAIRSKTDPGVPLTMRAFGLTANPVASIGAMSQYNVARDRTLDAAELRAFLKRIDALPEGVKKDALALSLLLGGQRFAQLLRARPVDVDLGAATITLYDSKGRRKQPRPHVLPLPKKALAVVRRRLDSLPDGAPFIFTTDGATALRPETMSMMVADIAASMTEAKEARERFEMRDLRRTCETMLAALAVSSDVRAQIQSHGLGGVQHRHYNRHAYALEKRAALEKWQRHLDGLIAGRTGKVVAMAGKKTLKTGPGGSREAAERGA